jgi:hypothetical protein
MSFRDVRGAWWAAREGRNQAASAPLLPALGRRAAVRSVLAGLAGFAIAWVLVDAGQYLLFERDPALRLDALRGLVPVSSSDALRTGEGHSYQCGFNEYGSVRLPAPTRPVRRRVLLLGDSESASYAIDPGQHYGALLARKFPDVEFVCESQPNYSVSDYIRIARGSNGLADFDLVVIQGCDEDVSSEAFSRSRGRGLAYATIVGDSVSVTGEPLGWTGLHLGFYNSIHRFDAVGRRAQLVARGLSRLLHDPLRKATPAAAADAGADISQMRPLLLSLRRAVAPPIVWVNLPRIHGVGSERRPETPEAAAFMAGLGQYGYLVADPSEQLFRYRSKSGGYANGEAVSQPGTGHLNPEGHRILYESVVSLVDSVLATPRGR